MKKAILISSLIAALAGFSTTALSLDKAASSINAALDAQPDSAKARYEYRHPKETLEFFGIAPGMTVVEALPGGGWYSKILLPVLGKEGALVGADYALDMWPKFGFFSEERLEAKKTWVSSWTKQAEEWRDENSGSITAFQFGALPESMNGSADAVLFIRALHNLSRFEQDGGFLTNALKETYAVLKPGGIVGVVQHQAREDRPDAWATGSNGYLKKSKLIEVMQAAGFEFVSESAINENPQDQAGEGDNVWRLAPTFAGSEKGSEERAAIEKIGESNRMTLKFRKPA